MRREGSLNRSEAGQQVLCETIRFVQEQHVDCVFVSPHFDDAVLSSGGLIAECARALPGKVHVVTVFTQTSPLPHTRHMRKFQALSQYQSARELVDARAAEDRCAQGRLGARFIHLAFVDAGYRKRAHPSPLRRAWGRILPEALHTYPGSFSIGRQAMRRLEEPLIQAVQEALLDIAKEIGRCIVFCQLGGWRTHIDHTITRQCCLQAFPGRVIYVYDYPYSLWSPPDAAFVEAQGLTPAVYGEHKPERREAIMCYASQLQGLFAGGIVPAAAALPDEVYYLNRAVLTNLERAQDGRDAQRRI
jgi:LmbE family N-acetylglucosaminyl deacetylase